MKHGEQNRLLALLMAVAMIVAMLPVGMVIPAAAADAVYAVDFNEAEDLNDFQAYYADNAKNGLNAAAMAENWTINNGMVERVQPAGKQYWMSNNDSYEKNGVGQTDYGLVAELVYTARKYTNFELTVDARQVSGISRQFGVGFGKTELGAFFVNTEGVANAAGGAYACVEKGGATNLFGYAINTVNGSTGALVGGRVQGTTVASGNSVEHSVKVRVEDSKMSMWVKAKGADDSSYVKVLTDVALKNYQGGYISLMTSANAAFDNLSITDLDPQIVSVESGMEINVAKGTALDKISFPQQVTVADGNGNTYQVPVAFACDSYDANTLGAYTFAGILDMSSVAAQNGSGLTASLTVNVMNAADIAAKVSVDFNESADLIDFTSYYAQNARDGLIATAFAEDWTNDGNVARLAKPHGIGGFWQSNNDGNGIYGYLAELVYTKRQYTNFELTVDAMQVAESIGRQFGIGFGKTELGAFFVDNNNQMNAAGGAYVGVERNGATNLWGYSVNTVNGSTGALANNARVQGTTVTSPVKKWHTVKVRVENSAVSMWVKDLGAEDSAYVQVLTDVALKNYQGGYISLMTNANAAFDNLTIINLDPQIVAVGAVNEIVVAQGTAAEDIDFPAQVTVTDENGGTYKASVSFSCASYDADTLGQYTFVGELNVDGMAVQNGSSLTASVVVNVLSVADFAARVSFNFNEAADLNDFASYYAKDAREGLTATAFAEDWTNNGNVARLAKPHGIGGYWQSNVDGSGVYGYMAELVYTKRQYTNFELTVDAMQVAESIGRQFGIGFGKTELGAFFVDSSNQANAAGGAYVGVERNGATNLWGYAVNTVNGSTNAIASNGRVGGTSVTSPCSKWHTVKVRVEDGKVSMWVKDLGAADSTYAKVLSEVALKDYTGGYISLMTNANAAFDNLLIVNLDKVETAEIEKWNLTLGEDIGANFYANVPEEHLADTTVAVTVAGQAAAAQTSTEDGYLKISVNVAAAQMTDDIVVSIVCNGITVEETYSVYQYALYVLADEKDEFDEKTEKLVKEMLNYGAAAQTYFGYNGENIIDADLIAGAGAAEIDSSNVTDMSVSGTVEGVSFYGASLLFKSKTAVRFYFTGDISECTVSAGTVKQAADGKYYVEIEGIVPQDLSQSITLTVQSGEQSIVVVYGPMNYIERMSEKGSAGLQQLLKAMYNYHLAAVEYAA